MNFSRNAALWIVILLLIFALFNLFQGSTSQGPQAELAFSEFLDSVDGGDISEVMIQGRQISGKFKDGSQFTTYAPDDPGLITELRESGGVSAEIFQVLHQCIFGCAFNA